MTHHAKASSAGSTDAAGNSRGLLLRALVARGVSSDCKGSRARSRRRPALFTALALSALFAALAAAPASAISVGDGPPVPDAAVESVSNVSYASAHLTGEVDFFGFGFGTFQSEVSTDGTNWTANAGAFAFSGPVSVDLTGLKGGTKYFVRLSANNFESTGYSEPPYDELTTLPVALPSVITIDNASEVAYTTAKATGKVERPGGANTSDPAFDAKCRFEYVTDAQFNAEGFTGAGETSCEPEDPIGNANAGVQLPVSANITGLTVGTTYHLRLSASNAGGTDSKVAASTFTTSAPAPPTVEATDNASEVAYTTAKATGKVNRPAGTDPSFNANCRFEYVTDAQFSATGFEGAGEAGCEPENPITNAGAGTTEVSANLSGLATGTTYHLRLSASNAGGSDSKVAASTFTTLVPTPPSVLRIDNASAVAYTIAKATGEVERAAGADPAFDANCRFEYVTDAQFNATGFAGAPEIGCEPENPITASKEVSANLTELTVGTKYHLRLTVSNAGGSDSEEAAATFTTLKPTPPSVSSLAIGAVIGTSAHFSGKVNSNGTDPAFATSWHFQCAPACPGLQGEVEADGLEHSVESNPTALQPNTNYQVKLVASNQGGQSETAPVIFKTGTVPPSVATLFSSEVEAHAATVAGKVNPHNSTTTYQFEYGLDKTYGSLAPVPPATLADVDDAFHEVTETLSGLQADTTYHFRFTATNTEAEETTHGVDHTFRTLPAAGPAICPNEQRRSENNSLHLPDCRAYEMVSPIEKNGNYAGAANNNSIVRYSAAAADGNGVLYPTGGAQGKVHRGLQSYGVSRRSATGWSSESAIPGGSAPRINVFTYTPYAPLPSSDLSKVVFSSISSYVPANPDTLSASPGIYLSNNVDGSIDWLSEPQIPNPFPAPGKLGPQVLSDLTSSWFRPVGGSPDLSTVYFYAGPTLSPSDAERTPGFKAGSGAWGLYEYSNGELRSAGTLPDGSESPGGAAPAGSLGGPTISDNLTTPDAVGNQVSRDGSTLFFLSPNPAVAEPQLYVRRNGHSTLVSHAQDGTAANVLPVPHAILSRINLTNSGQYVYASADGNEAIFYSKDALASGAPSDSSMKTYRYDVKTNTVTYMTGVKGTMLSASDDGSRLLFFDPELGVRLWDHGVVKTIAAGGGSAPARATPSGSVFVFSSAGLPGFNTGGQVQVFRYDVEGDQLSCLSCPPDGVNPSGFATISNLDTPLEISGAYRGEVLPNRGISTDGSRVFFDTPDPLVPQDENSVRDVYEWTSSGPLLISSGKSSENSYYLDNGADGSDVFFATSEGLDPRDADATYDVYDARVGGGFAQSAAVSPCLGNEVCLAAAGAQPTQPGPATNSFSPGPESSTKAKIKVGASQVAGGKLKLKVTVSAAGKLAASGKGLESASQTCAKAGSCRLALALKPSTQKTLREKHQLKLKVHLSFSPKSGRPVSANVVLTVKG